MRHILIYAYQLHFCKGSEYGLAWDHITQMSKSNRLTVLYGTCEGYHEMGNTAVMESYINNQYKSHNVRFISVKPDFNYKKLGYGIAETWLFYKQYRRYQECVFEVAKNIYLEDPFIAVHYLGPIGYREPGFLWKLPCRYIWGPVGGMVSIDIRLIPLLMGLRAKVTFLLKIIINSIQLNSIAVHRAMANSDIVLACSRKTKLCISKKYKVNKLLYIPQNCVKECLPLNINKFESNIVDVAWVGRIDAGKALNVAIDILSHIPSIERFRLNVVGGGDYFDFCKDLAQKNNVDCDIKWYGQLSRSETEEIIDRCHVLLLTSLYDVNPTVVWEAFSHCVPVVALETNGLEDFVTNDVGWLVPVSFSYQSMLKGFLGVFSEINSNREILKQKACHIESYRRNFSWEERSRFFNSLYEKCS